MPIPTCHGVLSKLEQWEVSGWFRCGAQWELGLSHPGIINRSIAENEVPDAGVFASLIKTAHRIKTNNHQLLAAFMVLMISAKSACRMGWFSTEDTRELISMTNEITNKFETDLNTEPSGPSLSVISAIMSRFYPRMKMERIIGFLEVKSGHHFYVRDFQFSKDLRFSPGDKIRLFVAQTDNIETSFCLVTPARVDFFLNGIQVDGRNSSFLDSGPQLPTDITPMLRDGSNFLQALGDFDGKYILAVAFMSELPNLDSASLQDYEHDPATVDADCVINEQASRISLNCPISFGRIKTPVRGRSCKHITCFDFDNYVEINSRRPHWRCPSCNKPASFSDISLDHNMYKILKEVDPNVTAINLYSDGSWAPEIVQMLEDRPSNTVHNVVDLTEDDDDPDGSRAPEIVRMLEDRPSNSVHNVADLTEDDDDPDGSWAPEIVRMLEDRPSNTVHNVVDLTEDDDDPMDTVQPNRQTSGVSATQLLTHPNREVEAGDERGSDVASSSQTVGYDDAGLSLTPGRM